MRPRRLARGEEAPLDDHLEELRGRLFVALGAVAVGTVAEMLSAGAPIHRIVFACFGSQVRDEFRAALDSLRGA